MFRLRYFHALKFITLVYKCFHLDVAFLIGCQYICVLLPTPKLKFYLFPLTRPTLKKPYSNNFISIFSQVYFFQISLQPERIVQCKQCYLSKLFVYLIVLPIVGLYSKTCLKRTLKDIHKGSLDKWALHAGRKYCRMLPGSILQYF